MYMKSSTPWIIGIIGIAIFYAYKKVTAATALTFTVKSVSIDGSLFAPTLKLSLNVLNTLNVGATINTISGNLYVNDKYVGQINQNINQAINGNSVSVLDINIDLSVAGIFDIISSLKANFLSSNYIIKFDGYINADGFNLPLTFENAI